MRRQVLIAVGAIAFLEILGAGQTVAITDDITYNVGSEVRLRVEGGRGEFSAAIRYAGEDKPIVSGIRLAAGKGFGPIWLIPSDARTGRYEVDLPGMRAATSFAVHRRVAQIVRVEMSRTFYTNWDPIDCRVTVRNASNRRLDGLRIEFAPFHYPWIAPAPDEPRYTPSLIAKGLSLEAGQSRELQGNGVATARGGDQPAVTGYVVIIWDDARKQIYDLAFTEPIFLRPPNTAYPKRYPFSYLYPSLNDVEKSAMTYRQFYPPQFVSDAIRFDTTHTMFPTGSSPVVKVAVHLPKSDTDGARLRISIRNAQGAVVRTEERASAGAAEQSVTVPALPDGLYVCEVSALTREGASIASNRLELALNPLPKSILIFGAHEDDDTAHPALIRAAVENHIPIHFVYFTSGDAGGCDRYYQRSCDAARALDFGETRMAEARASLGHLGVPAEDVLFLGLPDGGMEEIWLRHASADRPYLSVLLASDHAPYAGIVQPNLPFARNPVIAVVKDFIRRFRPEVIVTGHPEERHVDHRTDNWFVVKAMQELLAEKGIDPATRLLVDKSYGETSWVHSPYRFAEAQLFVPGEVSRLAQEALWFYQTQDGNHQFADLLPYEKLKRGEAYPHFWLLDWKDHAGWNERDFAQR